MVVQMVTGTRSGKPEGTSKPEGTLPEEDGTVMPDGAESDEKPNPGQKEGKPMKAKTEKGSQETRF